MFCLIGELYIGAAPMAPGLMLVLVQMDVVGATGEPDPNNIDACGAEDAFSHSLTPSLSAGLSRWLVGFAENRGISLPIGLCPIRPNLFMRSAAVVVVGRIRGVRGVWTRAGLNDGSPEGERG